MNKIYTKKGDKGFTKTFNGPMSKADQLAITLGTIDELNSWIGVCRWEISKSEYRNPKQFSNNKIQKEFKNIQTNLMTINSILAGSKVQRFPARNASHSDAGGKGTETRRLEKLIDKLTLELPELTNFIYPVGYLQVARAVARRAEREVVALEIKDKNILKYINRLSDALFVMARHQNQKNGIKEEIWK